MAHHIAIAEHGRLTRVVALVGPFCTIDLGSNNHLVLADRSVQEVHLRLREESFRWVVEDIGGALINGERKKTHVLAGGEQIQIDRILLHCIAEPSTGKEPVARESVERLEHLTARASRSIGLAKLRRSCRTSLQDSKVRHISNQNPGRPHQELPRAVRR